LLLHLARRLVTLVPVWIGITLLTFVLVHAIPGGPFDVDALRSPETTANLKRLYHLDRPLWEQYARYLGNVVFRGDLGESMTRSGLRVTELIKERFPNSALIGFSAIAVAVAVGLPAGVLGAVYRHRWVDYGVMLGSTVGYSIPSFVVSLLLVLFIGLKLRWLPLGGWGTPAHLVLPAVALGLPWAGLIARMARSAMLDVLGQDYVRTAEAKGAAGPRVVLRHALRNALIPLATIIGLLIPELLTGALAIELIFSVPGIGQYMVDSILGSDYTVTLGLTVFYATIIVIANLLVDVSYAWIDPRIRFG
jgi:ABC-type dipeptide/oligopeptide/nickel transport system permease component